MSLNNEVGILVQAAAVGECLLEQVGASYCCTGQHPARQQKRMRLTVVGHPMGEPSSSLQSRGQLHRPSCLIQYQVPSRILHSGTLGHIICAWQAPSLQDCEEVRSRLSSNTSKNQTVQLKVHLPAAL